MDSVDPVATAIVEAPDEESIEEEYGPVCTLCGVGCFNLELCGCTACTVGDKQMMMALFGLIVLIVGAEVALNLAEQDAISKAGPGVVSAATGAAQLLTVWKSIFQFLSMGVMAMIGSVRTHSKDLEAQAEADRKTGKVVQVALLTSVLTAVLSIALSFALYETYLQDLMGVSEADTKTMRSYLYIVAPTLLLYFCNTVLRGLCLQSGGLVMVALDVLLDSILGLALFLGWAKNAPDTDSLVDRVAMVTVYVSVAKFLFYLVYVGRQTSRFQLFDFSAAELPYSAIGIDLFWQWSQNICVVGSVQISLILVANLGKIQLLSYLASIQATKLTAIPGAIFSWYIVMFGSRYVGDKR